MKVALLSPITWRTPPVKYGPWEQVASVLTESMVKMGIDVTLFTTGDSITGAKLQSVCMSTGFLIHTIEEAVAFAGKLGSISREACRTHALAKFSSEVMAKHYLKLYERSTRRSGSIKDY